VGPDRQTTRKVDGLRFELPAGVATVIGALPFTATDASTFVLDELPQLPSAPAVELDATHLDVASVSAEVRAGLVALLSELRGRTEPIVMSLTGPVTVALDLRRQGMDDDAASRRAVTSVEETARWLLAVARRWTPDAPVLLFLTEPAVANSMHPTFPLRPIQIERLLAGVVDGLDSEATIGVQVAGRADWSMLLRTGIGVLAAPVGAQLESAAADIGRFLESGGIMAWGAVPVDEPLGVSPERLWKRLSATWCELTRLGVDPMLLRERSIITPSGGLGAFGAGQVDRVVELTQELGERVWRQTLGVRLSIGA
jgi:hypothetical protein